MYYLPPLGRSSWVCPYIGPSPGHLTYLSSNQQPVLSHRTPVHTSHPTIEVIKLHSPLKPQSWQKSSAFVICWIVLEASSTNITVPVQTIPMSSLYRNSLIWIHTVCLCTYIKVNYVSNYMQKWLKYWQADNIFRCTSFASALRLSLYPTIFFLSSKWCLLHLFKCVLDSFYHLILVCTVCKTILYSKETLN